MSDLRTEHHVCWMGADHPPMTVTATYSANGEVLGITVDRFLDQVLVSASILEVADRRFLRRDVDGFALFADNGTARYRIIGEESGFPELVYRAVRVHSDERG